MAQRTLQPWEIEHTKRNHVYKLPVGTIPSASLPEPDFEEASSSSDKDNGSGSQRDAIAKLLARRYYAIAIAHNARQFDITLPPWTLCSPNLRLEIAFGGGTGGGREVDLHEYLEIAKTMFGKDPGLNTELRDVTVQVDERGEVAEVFANQALVGRGLRRRSVVVAEFRKVEGGEWVLSKVEHVKGIDDGV